VYAVMRELEEPRALAGLAGAAGLAAAVILRVAPDWRWVKAVDQLGRDAQAVAPPPRAVVNVWTALLALAAIGLSASLGWMPRQWNAGTFLALRGEDGFWETLGALALAGAGVLFLMAGWLPRHRQVRWMYVALGAAMLLGALEEVSWGQRLIGFDTPEPLRAINVQQETNLHNLGGYWANALLLLVFLGYLGVLPLLAAWFVDIRELAATIGLPVPPLAFVPFGLIGPFLGDHPLLRSLWPETTWRLSEAREAMFSLSMCGVAVCTWVQSRRR
jgi:hypothetical protein